MSTKQLQTNNLIFDHTTEPIVLKRLTVLTGTDEVNNLTVKSNKLTVVYLRDQVTAAVKVTKYQQDIFYVYCYKS